MPFENREIKLWVKQNQFGFYALVLFEHSGRDPHLTNYSPSVVGAMLDVAKYVTAYISGLDHDNVNATMEATLPERTPAQDSQSARAFLRLGPDEPTMGDTPVCAVCGFHNADACAIIGHTYPVTK